MGAEGKGQFDLAGRRGRVRGWRYYGELVWEGDSGDSGWETLCSGEGHKALDWGTPKVWCRLSGSRAAEGPE